MKAVILIGVILLGSVYFLTKKDESPQSGTVYDPSPGAQGSLSPEGAGADSRYIADGIHAYASGEMRRILFFYADWCPTCRPVDQELSEKEREIPDDTGVYRINYNDSATDDEEKALAAKYSITYQHTFVQIDSSGQEITRWNGGGIDELLANIR